MVEIENSLSTDSKKSSEKKEEGREAAIWTQMFKSFEISLQDKWIQSKSKPELGRNSLQN